MGTLRYTCELPDDVLLTLDKLLVDRCGDDPQSYMVTEEAVGYVAPDRCYRLHADRLSESRSEYIDATASVESVAPPPHVRLRGVWNPVETVSSEGGNVFGGLGTLTLEQDDIAIPAAPATASALAFYGARLLSIGDRIVFETDHNLPVIVTNFGPTYVADYLHCEGRGSGSFIEYHDRPHLHMPLEDTARGYYLLGRSDGDEYLLSAFSIPYRCAIYTPPDILHADAYLVGRYLVIYAVPDNYSTVVFRTRACGLVKPRLEED